MARWRVQLSLSSRLMNVCNRFGISLANELETDRFVIHEEFVDAIHGGPAPYAVWMLDQECLDSLLAVYSDAPLRSIDASTAGSPWLSTRTSASSLEKLNADYFYRSCGGFSGIVARLLAASSSEVRNASSSPTVAVNVRAWETRPDAGHFGPSDWHTDGFAPGHMKMMIYLEGLGANRGSLEIEGEGEIHGGPGLVCCFRNSNLRHRAVPGSGMNRRPVVEITLQRVLEAPGTLDPWIGRLGDRHLSDPLDVYVSSPQVRA